MLDSLYARLARDTSAISPSAASCDGRDIVALCDAAVVLRRGELKASKHDVVVADGQIDRIAVAHPGWAEVWYLLAASELVGDDVGIRPRDGPMQSTKGSNPAEAERALLHALTIDSTFVRAAQALALVPIAHDGSGFLRARVDALRRARRLLAPSYFMAEADVEREAGRADSAIALAVRALRAGAAPRGLVAVTATGDLFGVGEDSVARLTYFGGATDTAVLSQKAYRDQLAWIATPAELQSWDSTAAPRRPLWLRQFWAERDLRDGRPGGSRLREQYQRLAEAEKMYRFRYSAVHRPDSLWEIADDRANRQRFAVIEDYAADLLGTTQPFFAFASRDDLFDDRGVMYLRQGMPHLSMRTAANGGEELWQYVRAGQPFYLSFGAALLNTALPSHIPYATTLLKRLDDTALFFAPAALIPTVADSADSLYGYLHQNFCALKASLCRAVPDSQTYTFPRMDCSEAAPLARISWRLDDRRFTDSSRHALGALYLPPPEDWAYIREREREEGEWTIALAQTTDDFSIPFDRAISPTFIVHVLARGTQQLLVAAVEISAKDLPVPEIDWTNNRITFPVRLHVGALRTEDFRRIDIDTTVTLSASDLATNDHHLAMLVELPLPPGHYQTAEWVNQLLDNSGALVHDDSVVVRNGEDTPWISDLLVGGDDDPLTWLSAGGPVHIATRGDVARHKATDLYYQLRGLTPGQSYRTSLSLFRVRDERTEAEPALTLAFDGQATSNAMDLSRHLDVGSLAPGTYRLRVVVAGDGRRVESSGCLNILK